MSESTTELAVPGVIYVGAHRANSGRAVVRLGPAVGWMAPRGIRNWEREIAVVERGALTEEIRKDLGIVMPEEQIPAAKMPIAAEAARTSPLVGVAPSLVEKLVAKGVRVHTVGFDKISGGFYYFADGGSGDAVRVQADMMEVVAGALGDAASDNAALERNLDEIIDRLLVELSKGQLDEVSVELANALPRAAADGTGMQDIDLDAFEKEASSLVGKSEKFQSTARKLAEELGAASGETAKVSLFGEAKRETDTALDVEVAGAARKLAARNRWIVTGPIKETADAGAASAAKAAAEKQAADERAAAEKRAAEAKAAAEKAAAEKRAAEAKAAADAKAAAEKAAAEKAAAERVAAEKAAAEKAAAEKTAAAEKKAAEEKAAADKKAAEEKAAAEKTAADEKAAAEKKAADAKKEADEDAADEKAEEKVAAAATTTAPAKKSKAQRRAEKQAAEAAEAKARREEKKAEAKKAEKKADEKKPTPSEKETKVEGRKKAESTRPAAKEDKAVAKTSGDKAKAKSAEADATVPTEGSPMKTIVIIAVVLAVAFAIWKAMGH